jgi:excisionase family DNA binding protein
MRNSATDHQAVAVLLRALGPEIVQRLALRPREAAKALGVSEKWLWAATKTGEIPSVKLGKGVVLYPVDLLRDYLARKVRENGGAA